MSDALFTTANDAQSAAPFVPTSRIDPDPSEAAVRTALLVDDAARQARVTTATDAIGDEVDQLDLVREAVEAANSHGGLTVESMVFAHLAVSNSQRRLGLAGDLLALPSMESMAGGRMVLSTEALTLSTEGVATSLKSLIKSQMANVQRSYNNVGWIAASHVRKLEKLIERMSDYGGPLDRTKIEVKTKELHINGSVPADLPKRLERHFAGMQAFARNWPQAAASMMVANGKLVDKVVTGSHEKFRGTFADLGRNLVDIRKEFAKESVLGKDIPGGYEFFSDRKLKYDGDNAAAKRLDEYANKQHPLRLDTFVRTQGPKTSELVPMSKEEIRAVATVLKSMYSRLDEEHLRIWQVLSESISLVPSSTSLILFGLMMTGLPVLAPASAGALLAGGVIKVLNSSLVGYDKAKSNLQGASASNSPGKPGSSKDVRFTHRAELRTMREMLRTNYALTYFFWYDVMICSTRTAQAFIDYANKSLTSGYKKIEKD